MRASIVAVMVLVLGGCTQPRVPDPCPETQRTRCMTDPVCETDSVRKCTKCRCSDPFSVPPGQADPRPPGP